MRCSWGGTGMWYCSSEWNVLKRAFELSASRRFNMLPSIKDLLRGAVGGDVQQWDFIADLLKYWPCHGMFHEKHSWFLFLSLRSWWHHFQTTKSLKTAMDDLKRRLKDFSPLYSTAAWNFHENIKNSRLNSVLRRHFRSPPTTSLIFDVVILPKHFQQFSSVFANVRVVCGLLKVSIIIIVIVNTLFLYFCSLPSKAARASSASWIHLIKDYCKLLFERFLPDVSKSLLERQTVVSFKFLSLSDRLLFLIWRSERSEGRNWINNWMNTQWERLLGVSTV